jgi:hypothetical protein
VIHLLRAVHQQIAAAGFRIAEYPHAMERIVAALRAAADSPAWTK